MTFIAWYLAIGTVLTLIIMSLLHEMTKKYGSLEIIVICVVDILLWPVLLLKMIRPTYNLVFNLITLMFDYFRGNFWSLAMQFDSHLSTTKCARENPERRINKRKTPKAVQPQEFLEWSG